MDKWTDGKTDGWMDKTEFIGPSCRAGVSRKKQLIRSREKG